MARFSEWAASPDLSHSKLELFQPVMFTELGWSSVKSFGSTSKSMLLTTPHYLSSKGLLKLKLELTDVH